MSRDASETGGILGRIGRLLRTSGSGERPPSVDDPELVVIVRCDDDTVATSTTLDKAGFSSGRTVVLRHLVEVPAAAVDATAASAGLEGYSVVGALAGDPAPEAGSVLLALARVQEVDARTVSQERSRTASLASRNGGRGIGWALLAVPPSPATDARR